MRNTCDLVEDALKRYYAIIHKHYSNNQRFRDKRITGEEKPWKADEKYSGYLDLLKIDLLGPCEKYPHEQMDEACTIFFKYNYLQATNICNSLIGPNS